MQLPSKIGISSSTLHSDIEQREALRIPAGPCSDMNDCLDERPFWSFSLRLLWYRYFFERSRQDPTELDSSYPGVISIAVMYH